VYGELEKVPADEGHRIAPRDPYGASKASFELYLPLNAHHYGLRFTTLRYANVYGPRQDPLGEAGVVAIFVAQMLRGLPTVINGDGEQERDFVYVGDVARASVLALAGGDGRVFNIGTGTATTVNAIYDHLSGLTGYNRPRFHGPPKPGEVRRNALDAGRIAREMGWKPLVGLEDGLRLTVEHFRRVIAQS